MGKMAKASGEDDQSRKICLKRGLGEVPEDPVCDSGIFCYGKVIFFRYLKKKIRLRTALGGLLTLISMSLEIKKNVPLAPPRSIFYKTR